MKQRICFDLILHLRFFVMLIWSGVDDLNFRFIYQQTLDELTFQNTAWIPNIFKLKVNKSRNENKNKSFKH